MPTSDADSAEARFLIVGTDDRAYGRLARALGEVGGRFWFHRIDDREAAIAYLALAPGHERPWIDVAFVAVEGATRFVDRVRIDLGCDIAIVAVTDDPGMPLPHGVDAAVSGRFGHDDQQILGQLLIDLWFHDGVGPTRADGRV